MAVIQIFEGESNKAHIYLKSYVECRGSASDMEINDVNSKWSLEVKLGGDTLKQPQLLKNVPGFAV